MLRLVGGGSVATLSSLAGCFNFNAPENPASGAFSHEEYTLGAKMTGWRGIEPEEINGELNPELKFRPEKSICVRFKNLDGLRHKLVIKNSMEDTLEESPVSSKEGETVSMTFESSQEMTTYICPYYSVQMVGTILCTKY
ncbi:hypothetical protein [Haladaptatus sp. CMAA 1911]|uniref:hypothetical protein n=1 Tax=unclassified Haladaptatus TaxID=2622732 RepID=UPI0037553946